MWLNPAEVVAWMRENGRSGKQGRPSHASDSPDLEAARLRKENALARRYELENARDERNLIPVNEVRQWVGENMGRAKHKLIGMASALAPRMEGMDAAERQQVIEQYVEHVIREIADARSSLA